MVGNLRGMDVNTALIESEGWKKKKRRGEEGEVLGKGGD